MVLVQPKAVGRRWNMQIDENKELKKKGKGEPEKDCGRSVGRHQLRWLRSWEGWRSVKPQHSGTLVAREQKGFNQNILVPQRKGWFPLVQCDPDLSHIRSAADFICITIISRWTVYGSFSPQWNHRTHSPTHAHKLLLSLRCGPH